MRKIVLSVAAAGAALIAASPAAAQFYPQQQPYGNAYGRNNNWGQVRSLQARLNNVERQINRLDRRDRIRNQSADRLRYEADRLDQRLRNVSRNGLSPYEVNDINNRIARLEQRVQLAANNRYGANGYNSQFVDRDRDGRDDRREDDRGYRHDD